jgi:hypothetical protein
MHGNKYVSVFAVLEEVLSFEGYSTELDWGDAVSWAGKCLALISAPALYVTKVTGIDLITPNVECTDYRGELPVDFVEILENGVRDSTSKEIYEYSGNVAKDYGGPTYAIRDNHIDISEETATLEIAYTAFKVDENGFPMIPDNERVIEAVRSYITYRMDHKLWRQNKIERAVYDESKTESMWYIGSAQNALRIMNPERRKVWTKYWTQVLPTMMSNIPSITDDVKEDYSGYVAPNVTYPDLPGTP